MPPPILQSMQGGFNQSLCSDGMPFNAPKLNSQTSAEELAKRDDHKEWLQDYAQKTESKEFMTKLWEVRCKFNQVLGVESEDRFNFGNTEDEKRGLVLDAWMDEVEKHKLAFRKVKRIVSSSEGPEVNQQQLQELTWAKELTLCRIHAYWAMIHPKEVHHIVKVLGCRASRFMQAISVHITPELLEEFENLFSRVVHRRYQLSGRPLLMQSVNFASVSNEAGDEDEDEEEVWDYLAAKSNSGGFMQSMNPQTLKVEIQFHWCGVPELLDTAKIKTIAELSGCASDSGVFAPIACRALLEHQWEFTFWYFLVDRALDLLCIFCLFMIVWTLKIGNLANETAGENQLRQAQALESTRGWFLVLVCVNSCLIFNIVCEASTALYSWTTRMAPSFGPYFSLTTMGLIGMELTTGYQLLCMWGSMMSDSTTSGTSAYAESVFMRRPVVFSMLILFKWLQFMSGCIVWEFFGLTVLPAFYAMTSSESMKFLLYVGLILTMCTHAYWSIPLAPDDYEMEGPLGSFFISFFRMFRLTVMGDFDVFELEGIDPMIDDSNTMDENPDDWSVHYGNATIGGVVQRAVVGRGKAFYFHKGIRIITMLFGVGCTVIVMNMYIGVLSVSYEENLTSRIETFCHAKSKFIVRYLLRRSVMRKVVQYVSCGQLFPDDNHEKVEHLQKMRAEDPQFWELFDRERAYMVRDDNYDRVPEGDDEEEVSPVEMPSEFTEDLLPQKETWSGFWCTVPANLLPERTDDQRFDKMEENQQDMKTKLEELALTVDQLQTKLVNGLTRRGRPVPQ